MRNAPATGSEARSPLLPLTPRLHPYARILGSGGYGTVYALSSDRYSREVAVKVLERTSEHWGAHFGEVLAMSLTHANLIGVLGVDFVGRRGDIHVFMELGGNATVADLVAARGDGCWCATRALQVSVCLARSLLYLHVVHGLVHQDVKPDNIMWCEATQMAKLGDFGTMRAAGTWTEAVGAWEYRAPELRMLGGRAWHQVTPELDAWSSGLVVLLLADVSHSTPRLPAVRALEVAGRGLAHPAPLSRTSMGTFLKQLGGMAEGGLSPTRSRSAPCFGCS